MKRKALLTLALVAIAIGISSTAMAQDKTTDEGSSVTVDVDNVTSINVAPETLSYSLSPGNIQTDSDSGYSGIEIENTGSENITTIYLSSSSPDTRPFGEGTAGAYDAGNFIQVKPSGEYPGTESEDDFHFIGRKDFNTSNPLSYVQTPSSEGTVRYGRYRVANESFFWAVTDAESDSNSGGNFCGGTGTSELLVGKTAHSGQQTGSVDFRSTSSSYESYSISDSADYYGKVNDVKLNTYEGTKNVTMLTWCGDSSISSYDNSTHVIGTRWNPQGRQDTSQSYSIAGDSLENLMNNPQDSDELHPGDHFTVLTRVAVPNGVANGQVSSGTLTINAEVTHDST